MRWSHANLREEINADAITHKENREDLGEQLRRSHLHLDQSELQVDRLTHQLKELQIVVKTLQEAPG